MMKNGLKRKRVLLLFSYYMYKIHLGIVRYAKLNNWILFSPRAQPSLDNFDFQFDGIITFSSRKNEFQKYLSCFKGPLVQLSQLEEKPTRAQAGCVYLDNHAIGRLAGEYFLSRGLRNITFVRSASTNQVEAERLAGLTEHAESTGVKIHTANINNFANTLPNLSLPHAVITENDFNAISVMNIIEDAGFHIPLDIALLGVDNDELCCELASTPLSSIDSNLEGRGYEAAKLLDKLITGETPPEEPLRVPPLGVVTRQSTDIITSDNPRFSRALNCIQSHFKENITPEDVAGVAGICRRRLDDIFREQLGHSVSSEIYRQRIQLAKNFLLNTDEKISVIATQTGFSSTHQFIFRFKQQTGSTPGKFRERENSNSRVSHF